MRDIQANTTLSNLSAGVARGGGNACGHQNMRECEGLVRAES